MIFKIKVFLWDEDVRFFWKKDCGSFFKNRSWKSIKFFLNWGIALKSPWQAYLSRVFTAPTSPTSPRFLLPFNFAPIFWKFFMIGVLREKGSLGNQTSLSKSFYDNNFYQSRRFFQLFFSSNKTSIKFFLNFFWARKSF